MTETQSPNNPSPRPWRHALLWAVVLSLLFMVVYGMTNWLASQRHDVPSLYFWWERYIPFVPAMIVPYMSIDLFFIASFFLCRQHEALQVHGRRIALAILIAGVFFALFPLQMAFQRPPVDGFYGSLFGMLNSFDQPYNLCPSLHIALRSILWPIFVRYACGWRGAVVRVWFILIGVSTLLTFQHHVIDIVGGQALAFLCMYVVPDHRAAMQFGRSVQKSSRGNQLARRYGLTALVLAMASLLWMPVSLPLLWLSMALGLVAAGYLWLGPAVFQKSCGKHAFAARCLLAPYLLGAKLSWTIYRRHKPAHVEIVPNLLIGRRPNNSEASAMVRDGIIAVVDLTAEHSAPRAFRTLEYLNLQVMDLTAPSPAQLEQAVNFIRQHLPHGKVYIHCALGYSRAACVAAAYLLAENSDLEVDHAIQKICTLRSRAVLSDGFVSALRHFHALRLNVSVGTTLRMGRLRSVD